MRQILFFFLLLQISAVSAQSVPNGTFENWNGTPFEELNGWRSSNPESLTLLGAPNVTKVAGFASTNAIRMETKAIGDDTVAGYVINTKGDPLSGEGGVPFAQQPTAITGFYRYNLAGNDSAILLVIFKKSGIVISADVFKIRGTGSQLTFTNFSYPLSLPMAPDSVIIAASCSNAIEDAKVAGSWMELDSLEFTGPSITQIIPNGKFENWMSMNFDVPQGWYMTGLDGGVSKTTDKYTGTYAVKLVTQDLGGGDIEPAGISTGKPSSYLGGQTYTLLTDTLAGYYKYTPAGNDTASIGIRLAKNGMPAGGTNYKLTAKSTYTYFEVPFTAFQTPDSIRIDVLSSDWSNLPTIGGSALYLDKLQLKSQPLGIGSIAGKAGCHVYPNPVHDKLQIEIQEHVSGVVSVVLYDAIGKQVLHNEYRLNGGGTIAIPVAQLPAGSYYYNIRTGNSISCDKFVKE